MNRWHKGLPPRDDREYEVKQRMKNAGGQWITVQWAERAFWVGSLLRRRSQMHGGLVAVLLTNRWRLAEPRPTT